MVIFLPNSLSVMPLAEILAVDAKHISSCLPTISTWRRNGHLKGNIASTTLNFLLFSLYLLISFILLVKPPTLVFSLTPLVLLQSHCVNKSRQYWLQNRCGVRSSLSTIAATLIPVWCLHIQLGFLLQPPNGPLASVLPTLSSTYSHLCSQNESFKIQVRQAFLNSSTSCSTVVTWGCCKKLLQTGWLEATKT